MMWTRLTVRGRKELRAIAMKLCRKNTCKSVGVQGLKAVDVLITSVHKMLWTIQQQLPADSRLDFASRS